MTSASLFTGVYRPTDIARYFRAELGDVASPWRIGSWARKGLAHPKWGRDLHNSPVMLTFEDLVSLRMVAIFRQYGHTLQYIREVQDCFRKLTDDPLPFATRNFWVDEGDIFLGLHEHLISGIPGGGDYAGQAAFEFLRRELHRVDLDFDDQDRASAWYPYQNVSLRPTIQWGEPCVKGTRIPTQILWGMINCGTPLSEVALDYGLDERKVEDARQWETRLRAVA